MSNYRLYEVEILFKNEGEVYGRESYKVMALDEDGAERKAMTNATASIYDDSRIPDRRLVMGSCEVA